MHVQKGARSLQQHRKCCSRQVLEQGLGATRCTPCMELTNSRQASL